MNDVFHCEEELPNCLYGSTLSLRSGSGLCSRPSFHNRNASHIHSPRLEVLSKILETKTGERGSRAERSSTTSGDGVGQTHESLMIDFSFTN